MLGTLTALMGRRAIAATTIAIESVVLRHLAEQQEQLQTVDPEAAALIASIIDDDQRLASLAAYWCGPSN